LAVLGRKWVALRAFRVKLPHVDQVVGVGGLVEFRERLVELVDEGRIPDEVGVPHRMKVSVAAAKF
jgi:hypothetical protein